MTCRQSGPHPRRGGRLFAVFTVALFASGCTGLVYNRLDALAGWYLGNLVSLEAAQRQDLRAWLTRLLEWHRASELSRYAEFLREIARQVSQPGNRATYERVEQRMQAFGQAVIAQAAPEAAQLLRGLTDAQLEELETNLEKRARERAEESAEEFENGAWRKERNRDLRRQVKRWTGNVTKEQRSLIADSVKEFEPTFREWGESQREWRSLLFAALRARFTPDSEQQVLELLRQPNRQWTPAYTAKNQRNRERSLNLLERLDASLTSAQRAHAQRELEELAQQLEGLQEP